MEYEGRPLPNPYHAPLLRSTDGGESWEPILWPYVFNIEINESNPQELFFGETYWPEECGTEGCEFDGHIYGLGRIWRSRDGAETFEFLDEAGGLNVSDLAYNPSNQTLYTATYGQGLRKYIVVE